jgi:hypothetical protein
LVVVRRAHAKGGRTHTSKVESLRLFTLALESTIDSEKPRREQVARKVASVKDPWPFLWLSKGEGSYR